MIHQHEQPLPGHNHEEHSLDSHSHGGHSHSGHSHDHHVVVDASGRVGLIFRVSLILTALFVALEFGAGLWSNSLALISDAGHNLTDGLALAFSWFALVMARRSPNYSKTYGYHRAGILAATLNAVTLILIALYVFYEGIQRLLHPEPVEGQFVIVVASVGLALNSAIAFALSRASKEDLNVRSAFLHLVGDALASAGAILAGVLTLLTGQLYFDPLISILIGLFILWSSWGVMKEATNILLEGIPAGLDMVSLMRDLMAIPEVKSVHDLHVWTISGNFRALSCHVLTDITGLHEANALVHQIKEMLIDDYNIRHATIEIECHNCVLPDEIYCSIVKTKK